MKMKNIIPEENRRKTLEHQKRILLEQILNSVTF